VDHRVDIQDRADRVVGIVSSHVTMLRNGGSGLDLAHRDGRYAESTRNE
jgi:hypothetical protein